MATLDTTRRTLVGSGVAWGSAWFAGACAARVPAKTVTVEQTYLKAKPERREDLARYIELNWFEMDRLGAQAGLFTFYELMEEIDENAAWDLVMVVGYPTPRGYEDALTQERFTAIRKQHKEVKVKDLGLADLGAIVEHHRLRIRPGGTR